MAYLDQVELVEDWAAWLEAFSTFVAAVVLSATAVIARSTLEDAKRTRHAQLLVELNKWWASAAIIESQKLLSNYTKEDLLALVERLFGKDQSKRLKDDVPNWETLQQTANFIENIGVLHDEGALTAEVIYKNWGGAILEVWEAWSLAVPRLQMPGSLDTYRYFKIVAQATKVEHTRAEAHARANAPALSG